MTSISALFNLFLFFLNWIDLHLHDALIHTNIFVKKEATYINIARLYLSVCYQTMMFYAKQFI